jgi:hypothetical protein
VYVLLDPEGKITYVGITMRTVAERVDEQLQAGKVFTSAPQSSCQWLYCAYAKPLDVGISSAVPIGTRGFT